MAGEEKMRIGAGTETEDKIIERECWEVGSPDHEDLAGHYKEFDFISMSWEVIRRLSRVTRFSLCLNRSIWLHAKNKLQWSRGGSKEAS